MLFMRPGSFISVLLVILSFLSFMYIVTSDLGGFMKGLTAVLLLLATGLALRRITKADGWSGFMMLRVKRHVSRNCTNGSGQWNMLGLARSVRAKRWCASPGRTMWSARPWRSWG